MMVYTFGFVVDADTLGEAFEMCDNEGLTSTTIFFWHLGFFYKQRGSVLSE